MEQHPEKGRCTLGLGNHLLDIGIRLGALAAGGAAVGSGRLLVLMESRKGRHGHRRGRVKRGRRDGGRRGGGRGSVSPHGLGGRLVSFAAVDCH